MATFEQPAKAAESSNHAKSLFLANIIHELRTPMNAILGYAQLLERAQDIPKRHRHAIETIEKSGGHLLALINDVLDLSKIEAGCMELQLSDFDLNALLYDLSAMFDIRSSQKKLHWRVEIWHPPDGPLAPATSIAYPAPGAHPAEQADFDDAQMQMQGWRLLVHGDERKLRQVLINLLSNAVNFTESGEIVLKVILPHEQNGSALPADPLTPGASGPCCRTGQYYFEVRDTGPGIAPDAQAGIFEAFHQGPDAAEKGGTGLGLSIARRLISIMGGELHLESQPGAGSRFFFAIPLTAAGSPTDEGQATARATLDYSQARIPGKLHERLKTTAELYSTTEFKLCLRELEQLGEHERSLTARFRELLQSYDMESIVNILTSIQPVE